MDTDIEDATDNIQPNIWCRGFNPANYMKTNDGSENDAPTNVTLFSAGMWQAYFFAAPEYCFYISGTYNIPFVYENMDPTNPIQPVQFEYIQDFAYTDADFTVQGVNENKIGSGAQVASVSQNFPNPFNGQTFVNISLKQGSNVSLDVFTLTGQKVSTKNYGYLTTGSHNLTISSNNLPTGVYFYTVNAGVQKVTRKMIVQ